MRGFIISLLIVAATMHLGIGMPIFNDEAEVIEDRSLDSCQIDCGMKKDTCINTCALKVGKGPVDMDEQMSLCNHACRKAEKKCRGDPATSTNAASGCYSELVKRQF